MNKSFYVNYCLEIFQLKMSTCVPFAIRISPLLDQFIHLIGSFNLSSNNFLEVRTYHMTRYPSASPVIKYFPLGLISIASTEALCP
jgi:hypothetical protein